MRRRVHVFLPVTGNQHQERERERRVGCEGRGVRGNLSGLEWWFRPNLFPGDFCVISKIITLANNLFCRYEGQICQCSAI